MSSYTGFTPSGGDLESPEMFFNQGDSIIVSWWANKSAPCNEASNDLEFIHQLITTGGFNNVNNGGNTGRVAQGHDSAACDFYRTYAVEAQDSGSFVAELHTGTYGLGQINVEVIPVSTGSGGTATTSPYMIDVASLVGFSFLILLITLFGLLFYFKRHG